VARLYVGSVHDERGHENELKKILFCDFFVKNLLLQGAIQFRDVPAKKERKDLT